MIPQGIFAELVQAKWRLWHAKRAGDEIETQKAIDQIDQLLETIIERQADL